MSYKNQTIIDTIKGVNDIYFLPSIQRKFVWDLEQIENLFDSIMRGYPIGTFLFWLVEKGEDPSHIDDYTFYQFISDYHEDEDIEFNQKKLNKPSTVDKVIAVLDGQQRLSSLYCALKGSYSYKTSKKDSPYMLYPKRELYLNLLYHGKAEQSNVYEFKFKTNSDAAIKDVKQYWLKVKDIISWSSNKEGEKVVKKKAREIRQEIKEIFAAQNKKITEEELDEIVINIEELWRKLIVDEIITYYEINKSELDEVLDIFVRVNSAGTPLSRSDLVFSTIVAHWEDGREKIESLLDILNEKGDNFKFDKDFLISLCLALMDLPQKFEVKTFTRDNVKRVESEWDNITSAICETVDLLVEFGFNGTNLTAQYIIIPVAYYLYKTNKPIKKLKAEDKKNIRIFLISGMIKKIFSGGVDSVLTTILSALKIKNETTDKYELKHKDRFDYNSIADLNIQEKTIKIEYSDLDAIVNLKKGPLTFMVLSLLYPHIKFKDIKWHQDHIHPKTLFDKSKLKKYLKSVNVEKDDDILTEWKNKSNTLGNLQLLVGQVNQEKSKTPLKQWINKNYNTADKVKRYCDENYIDEAIGFELSLFDEFYEKRKEILKSKLISILNISVEDAVSEYTNSQNGKIKNTIIDAVFQVLTDHPEGLNLKEIYSEIIKNKLYEFKAVNPLGVLAIEIQRHCIGSTISNPSALRLFKVTQTIGKDHYYALIGKEE